MSFKSYVILMGVVLFAGSGAGETIRTVEREDRVFQAGPGVLISDKAQEGVDTDVWPIPAVYYREGRFSIFGPRARYVLHYEEDDLLVGATAQMRNEGYEDDDSRVLRGMGERRATLEAGLTVRKYFGWGRVTAEWTSDVLNEHKGHEIELLANRWFNNAFDVEGLRMLPTVGVNWRSKQLNDHYYGVEADEARGFRPAYEVGSTVGLLTSLRVDYPLNDQWNLFSSVSAEWFDGEITDSPIVGQHYKLTAVLGAMYKF
ncbi:Outer membrane protein OmpV precursor [Anaerohalosphaera lusitana]|uniref:Outer membrane protein OmpV n=1 Tax=Anaerohalosphaera lusitana TaxID=1936003 RepID=A0A1U9NN66_9BACT|nr:MipA/OmpV family protein [Anaerohalosphaera lusitana]AQT69339.1 Outer membrane protein OmpV precursor [Anaerohalosphaera lusitana]